jgi:hypothetical protein
MRARPQTRTAVRGSFLLPPLTRFRPRGKPNRVVQPIVPWVAQPRVATWLLRSEPSGDCSAARSCLTTTSRCNPWFEIRTRAGSAPYPCRADVPYSRRRCWRIVLQAESAGSSGARAVGAPIQGGAAGSEAFFCPGGMRGHAGLRRRRRDSGGAPAAHGSCGGDGRRRRRGRCRRQRRPSRARAGTAGSRVRTCLLDPGDDGHDSRFVEQIGVGITGWNDVKLRHRDQPLD